MDAILDTFEKDELLVGTSCFSVGPETVDPSYPSLRGMSASPVLDSYEQYHSVLGFQTTPKEDALAVMVLWWTNGTCFYRVVSTERAEVVTEFKGCPMTYDDALYIGTAAAVKKQEDTGDRRRIYVPSTRVFHQIAHPWLPRRRDFGRWEASMAVTRANILFYNNLSSRHHLFYAGRGFYEDLAGRMGIHTGTLASCPYDD